MNKKADYNLTGMLIGIGVVGVFFGVMAALIGAGEGNYDITGYVSEDLNSYIKETASLNETLINVSNKVDQTVSDSGWIDYFSGIFDFLTAPFKLVYNTFKTVINLVGDFTEKLQLSSVFSDFFISMITAIVIVGIVMIKHYFARNS